MKELDETKNECVNSAAAAPPQNNADAVSMVLQKGELNGLINKSSINDFETNWLNGWSYRSEPGVGNVSSRDGRMNVIYGRPQPHCK